MDKSWGETREKVERGGGGDSVERGGRGVKRKTGEGLSGGEEKL